MLSALDLARRMEAGTLSPKALIDEVAAAVARSDTLIRAFTHLDLSAARAVADQIGEALAVSRLRGLPVAVKDNIDTADMPTSYGSAIFAGHRPAADAAIVCQIRRAGGLIVGKTVSTEFAYFTPGPTRNPANPEHTPGGSSSGSAAAVAAGMVPVALGSQTAGSIIRPAAYCGVTGYKPSFKLLPMVGVKAFAWSLDTIGFFARGVADVAFAAGAIADRDLRVDGGTPSAPRIALVRSHLWPQAGADGKAALERAARAAQAAGARVTDLVLPPLFEDAYRAQTTVMGYEAYRALADEYDRHGERLSPRLRQMLHDGGDISADAYDDARRTANRARKALADLMVDTDAILTLSAPGAAPAGIAATGDPMFNRLWTLLGAPCINVTGLRTTTGLPLGVQVVGRFGRDKAALEAALFIEVALGRADPEIAA
jgi:Asp-tRNA(Asn)/Glu-tRNA(Gln) amidotransferase A subunit family amidase